MKYLFLEDNKTVFDEVNKIQESNITCILLNPKKKDCCKSEVENCFSGGDKTSGDAVKENSVSIITDYGIRLSNGETEFQSVFKFVLNEIIEKYGEKIKTIIIYSYQLPSQNSEDFLMDIREARKLCQDNGIHLIEKITSATFVREKPLYKNEYNFNPDEANVYAKYIKDMVESIISDRDSFHIDEKNLDLEKWMFYQNTFFQDYRIGTLSYLSPEGMSDDYAIDIPYKKYYVSMNDILTSDENYVRFLKNPVNEDFDYIHLQLQRFDTTLKCKLQTHKREKNLESIIKGGKSLDKLKSKNISDFWIISLYVAIYYEETIEFKENKYKGWSVEMIDGDCESFSPSVEIFWFYHKHHYEFLDKKGYLNFTLYRQPAENTKCTTDNDIPKKAIQLYETNRNLLEAKVLESLAPHYVEGMQQQSNLNAISSIVIYNMTHTDGSHTIIDAVRFINAISDKTKSLAICSCSDKSCKSCKYYDLHDSQNNAYNEQMRLIMETSDALSKGFTENTYFTYTLEEVLKYWKSVYFSKEKPIVTNGNSSNVVIENFLGRGLNDGTANSVLTFSKTDKEVLFPLGDLGTTAVLIILKNIFRNLKKHSKSLLRRPLEDKYKNLKVNHGKEEKPIYKVNINLTEFPEQHSLYHDYYKIECIEKSNAFSAAAAEKIIHSINLEFGKKFSSQDMGSGWGLKEMKIFASFLIGYPLYEDIPDANEQEYREYRGIKYPIDIIKAEKVECENSCCEACSKYKCEDCIKREKKCEKCNDDKTCDACMEQTEKCSECQGKKYHISHVFFIKKPKFATIIQDENGEPTELSREYQSKGFILKNRKDANLQSPVHFVLGFTQKDKSSESRMHYNFRVLNKDFAIVGDNAESDNKAIQDRWVKDIGLKDLELYEKGKDGEFKKLIGPEEVAIDKLDDKLSVAIIDDHVSLLEEKWEKLKCDTSLVNYLKEFAYYEEQSNSCKSRRFYKKDSKAPRYMQLESLNYKIGIWDERIQQYLQDTYHNIASEVTLGQIYSLKHVYIPDFNLQNAFYPEDDSIISEEEKQYSEMDLPKFVVELKEKPYIDCQYLVIHYSGFEKIVERTDTVEGLEIGENMSKEKKIKAAYEYMIGKNGLDLKKSNRFLVFTSGKSPATLPDNTLFINFSTLDRLIRYKTKYELTAALTSLRIQKINLNT